MKRLEIAEQELDTCASCKLRSHGKIRYHLLKDESNSRSKSSTVQIEGVFVRDEEKVHDDDDYETEIVTVSGFRPDKFVSARNWIFISDHDMDHNKFSKDLTAGLYCFILRSSDSSDALMQLGAAAKQDVALMHASIQNREVSDAEYHQAKRGAFLFFEVRHSGLTFHDSRMCKPLAADSGASGDVASFAAWHDHHGHYGRLHLNHGLSGDALSGGKAAVAGHEDIGSDSDSDEDSEDDGQESQKIGADAQWSYKEDETGIHLRGNFAKELSPRELFQVPSRPVVGHRMSFHLNLGVPAWNGMLGKWICFTRD